jgi:phenol 2-monooxygenase (NADPH)
MPPAGRYHILVFTSKDLLSKTGVSQPALQSCIDTIQEFPPGVIDLVILHPLQERFEWTDLPPSVKSFAEMRVYGSTKNEDAFDILGVNKDQGLIAVIRPDGYVGVLAPLSASQQVESYFRGCVVGI